MFKDVLPFSYYRYFTIICGTWAMKTLINSQMNHRVHKDRLGTSRFDDVFYQDLPIWSHLKISGITNWLSLNVHAG